MINYFEKEFLLQAIAQRKKTLLIYFLGVALYLAMSVIIMIIYLRLPYESPKIAVLKTIEFSLTGILIVFSFIYLGIKYKRINKYCTLCKNIAGGIKEEFTAYFFEYDESLSTKDGVDVKALVFLQWNKFKNNYFERKVWVFYEKPFPEFNEHDKVRFITQGNVLVSYEIIDEED